MRTSALATRLAVVLLLATLAAAQTPSITIDQIHSEQVTNAAKIPNAEWLEDGTAIVL